MIVIKAINELYNVLYTIFVVYRGGSSRKNLGGAWSLDVKEEKGVWGRSL